MSLVGVARDERTAAAVSKDYSRLYVSSLIGDERAGRARWSGAGRQPCQPAFGAELGRPERSVGRRP